MTQPAKPRPTGIWVGAAMMVAAVLVVILASVLFYFALGGDSEIVAVDGDAHEVTLPADEKYGLFVDSGDVPGCELADGDGTAIALGPVSGEYTVNEWTAERSFQTGDGDVTITCAQDGTEGGQVRLGPLPSIGGLVALMLGGIALAALLGVGGLAILIISIVRRNRPVTR